MRPSVRHQSNLLVSVRSMDGKYYVRYLHVIRRQYCCLLTYLPTYLSILECLHLRLDDYY